MHSQTDLNYFLKGVSSADLVKDRHWSPMNESKYCWGYINPNLKENDPEYSAAYRFLIDRSINLLRWFVKRLIESIR